MRHHRYHFSVLDITLLEQAIGWTVALWGEQELTAARAAVESQIAPLAPGEIDYEPSISHFFERYLCAGTGAGPEPRAILLSRSEHPPHQAARDQLLGWAHSHRSLYAVRASGAGRLHLEDLVWGGQYGCAQTTSEVDLVVGDRMDARIVPLGGSLFLSPGRLFHPREAHPAIDGLLRGLLAPPDERVLDALLRMRASFLRFASMRAEHVYRVEGLTQPGLSAPWVRRPGAS